MTSFHLPITLVRTFFFLFFLSVTALAQQTENTSFDVTDLGYCNPELLSEEGFEKLKQKFADKRIIMLGEPSHGIGTGYENFAHFIKFLHEEMGFNVIAQEYCFYSFGEMNKRFQQGISSHGYRKYMYQPQGNSVEMNLLFNYLDECKAAGDTIFMEGFDSRISARRLYYEYLHKLITGSAIPFAKTDTYEPYMLTLQNVVKLEYADTVSADTAQLFLTQTDLIIEQLEAKNEDSRNIQLLKNLKGFVKSAWNVDPVDLTVMPEGRYYQRELQLFDNLKWLLEVAYPDEKFIVIMHNDHVHKGFLYMLTLGELMHKQYGDLCMNIGTTYYEGKSSKWTYETVEYQAAKPESMEGILHAAGYEYAYVDLTEKKDSFTMFVSDFNSWNWNDPPNFKQPYGQNFDGMIYIRTAKEATRIKTENKKEWLLEQKLPVWALEKWKDLKLENDYFLSNYINPFYLEEDFNGDKKKDIAITVKHKTSHKCGIVILHAGSGEHFIIGADTTFGRGGTNYNWMDVWKIYESKTVPVGFGETEKIGLKGKAIYVESFGFASALIYWNGREYNWYQQDGF